MLGYLLFVILVLGVAIYLVPIAAERISRRQQSDWDHWIHEHETRQRKDPK
jgi:hypothetical protein